MEFKNIHDKKNFIKLYEFGGREGGPVSGGEGFANNLALKDTYLGKLINGIFKGIGWLWRKSKENFLINRLNAQLVNELLRGVIIFCFENNIDLISGKRLVTGEINGVNKEEYEEDENKEESEEKITEYNIPKTKEDVVKRIEELKLEISEDENDHRNKIIKYNRLKNDISVAGISAADKKKKQEEIDVLRGELKDIKFAIDDNKNNYLPKLEQKLKDFGTDSTIIKTEFDILSDSVDQKYGFIPTAEDPEGLDSGSFIPYNIFKDNINKKYKMGVIQINDKFTIINDKGELEKITVYDVNNSTGEIKYFPKIKNEGGKPNIISSVKLLPEDFPGFAKIKKECYDFLKKYIPEYKNMVDDDKDKIEKIYMHYSIIDQMSKIDKSSISSEKYNESTDFIDEFGLLLEETISKNISDKVSSSGSVNVKMDNPQAGKVNLARSLSTNIMSSVSVGDILTTRDKSKYKDKSDNLKTDIHKINLAEIEKTIQQLEKKYPDSNVKLKVSTCVNPYNLKVIQLSAEELMLSKKGETDNSLKIRWSKEVNKTYASFTNIMDISKINIVTDNFSGELNNKKLDDRSKDFKEDIKNQESDAPILANLPLEEGFINYSKMSDGKWCYYSFSYKNNIYKTTIAPVSDVFNNFGLICITSALELIDEKTHTAKKDDIFKKFFSSSISDNPSIRPEIINVYFLFVKDQRFPDSNKSYPAKVFVLNEYLYNNKTKSSIYIKKNNSSECVTLTESVINSLDKNKYLYDIKSINCKKFKSRKDIEPWRIAFNLNEINSVNCTDFRTGSIPKFLKLNTNYEELLKKLVDKLK